MTATPTRVHGPWVDVHAHPGRCFLAGAAIGDPLVELLGSADTAAALSASRGAGMTAVSFATVADLRVLAPTPEGGLVAGRSFEPGEAQRDHQRQLVGMRATLEAAGAQVAMTASDIERAHAAGATVALLTCEGGDFVEGELSRLEAAHALGVSSLTLVHYRVNELGDIQTASPVHGGLTDAGRAVVRECNRLGMIVDCAHATLATTLDVLGVSAGPLMISHSHLDHADRSHPRLLSPAHATAVAAAGGLIGAWPSGVTSATLDDFVDEIIRLVDVVGLDHVAIGTDLDANYRPVVTAHEQFALIDSQLADRGFSPGEADQVLGGNAVALYRSVAG